MVLGEPMLRRGDGGPAGPYGPCMCFNVIVRVMKTQFQVGFCHCTEMGS